LIAPDAIGRDPALPEPTRGPDGVKQAAMGYRGGFPDLQIAIDDQCAEGELVCTRWTARGTNAGDFWGVAATGKQVTVTGITMDRIAGGQVIESWTNWDALGLL
jgi:predicted ester cyclase